MKDATEEEVVRARVAYALDAIQEAQDTISRAGAALSSITGGASVSHARLMKVYGQIKREWYRLDQTNKKKWHLDHEPNEYDEKYLRSPRLPTK